MFTALPTPLPFLDDKRLVILGTADATRLPTLPNVPTLAEAGLPGFEFSAWAALLAPAGTPPEIIDRLNAAANAALSDPEVHKQLTALGYEVVGGPPSALAALIERDYQAKGDILRAANIHADSAAPAVIRPAEQPVADRGGGNRTTPLVRPGTGARQLINGITTIAPGGAIGLDGQGVAVIDDVEHPVGPGDTSWIPPGLPHYFRNVRIAAEDRRSARRHQRQRISACSSWSSMVSRRQRVCGSCRRAG